MTSETFPTWPSTMASCSRAHLAREYRSRRDLRRPGVELDADIRSNHRAEDGDVVLVVDAQEHEERWLILAASGNRTTKQERSAADKCSSHLRAIKESCAFDTSVKGRSSAAPLRE